MVSAWMAWDLDRFAVWFLGPSRIRIASAAPPLARQARTQQCETDTPVAVDRLQGFDATVKDATEPAAYFDC